MSKTGSFARHYLKWYLYKCQQFRLQKCTAELLPKSTKKFILSILTGMEIGTKTTTLKSTINIWLIGLITPTDTQFTGHSNKHHLLFANWQQPNNFFLTWRVCNVKGRSKEVLIQWDFDAHHLTLTELNMISYHVKDFSLPDVIFAKISSKSTRNRIS